MVLALNLFLVYGITHLLPLCVYNITDLNVLLYLMLSLYPTGTFEIKALKWTCMWSMSAGCSLCCGVQEPVQSLLTTARCSAKWSSLTGPWWVMCTHAVTVAACLLFNYQLIIQDFHGSVLYHLFLTSVTLVCMFQAPSVYITLWISVDAASILIMIAVFVYHR